MIVSWQAMEKTERWGTEREDQLRRGIAQMHPDVSTSGDEFWHQSDFQAELCAIEQGGNE